MGRIMRGKPENLAALKNNLHFEFIEMDLSAMEADRRVHTLLKTKNIDTIFHLAAINGTQHFYDHSSQVLDQNIMITRNMMMAIENTPVKKVIYTSSSEVYGEPTVLPTPETHPL